MELPWDVGNENLFYCSRSHDQKMASRPKYEKQKHSKSPSWEPRCRWLWNLVYDMGYLRTFKFVQMLAWVDVTIFMTVTFVSYCFYMGESLHSIQLCFPKLVLIQHVSCTQVSDTRPLVLWFNKNECFILFTSSSDLEYNLSSWNTWKCVEEKAGPENALYFKIKCK